MTKKTWGDRSEDILLAVDFQNVYLPGNPWECPDMIQAMENTVKILRSPGAPEYIFTKFIAPDKPVGCWSRYNEKYADINADPYMEDVPDLIREFASGDNIVEKSTYSSMHSERVMARIRGKKRIALTGVVAECCVMATMMDAIDMGYEVIYLYDCISGCTPENERAILALAKTFCPIHTQVMTCDEYISLIAPA